MVQLQLDLNIERSQNLELQVEEHVERLCLQALYSYQSHIPLERT